MPRCCTGSCPGGGARALAGGICPGPASAASSSCRLQHGPLAVLVEGVRGQTALCRAVLRVGPEHGSALGVAPAPLPGSRRGGLPCRLAALACGARAGSRSRGRSRCARRVRLACGCSARGHWGRQTAEVCRAEQLREELQGPQSQGGSLTLGRTELAQVLVEEPQRPCEFRRADAVVDTEVVPPLCERVQDARPRPPGGLRSRHARGRGDAVCELAARLGGDRRVASGGRAGEGQRDVEASSQRCDEGHEEGEGGLQVLELLVLQHAWWVERRDLAKRHSAVATPHVADDPFEWVDPNELCAPSAPLTLQRKAHHRQFLVGVESAQRGRVLGRIPKEFCA
mmetsp:Transcript_80540/g.240061  ORF Transcript_80540/g.240061 Transcript_80540/m.240061 type:complete len:341 (-) Transcript_80540:513-1535(-)